MQVLVYLGASNPLPNQCNLNLEVNGKVGNVSPIHRSMLPWRKEIVVCYFDFYCFDYFAHLHDLGCL